MDTINKIGKGFVASVYKVESNGSTFALKEFSPSWVAKLAYWLAYRSRHVYSTERGVKEAFYRRRIASRLSKLWDEHNYIVDAVAMHNDNGFLCQYTRGVPVSRGELDRALAFADRLKENLRGVGLPTASLEGLSSKRSIVKFDKIMELRNVIVDEEGFFKVIDFESGIPRIKGVGFVLDDTDLEKLENYVIGLGNEDLRQELELLKRCINAAEVS